MSKEETNFENANATLRTIVFVPGLKGTRLRDKKGTVWLGTRQALLPSFYKTSDRASLPLATQHGQEKDSLTCTEILLSVGPLSFYNEFISKAKELGVPMNIFTYDWRRDMNEIVEELKTYLNNLYTKHNKRIQLIGHSLGGLISLAALNEMEEDLFDSIAFVGTPFGTGPSMLEDLNRKWAQDFLNFRANFTFPSSFVFFPLLPTDGEMGGVYEFETKTKIEIDFSKTESYVNYKLLDFLQAEPSEEELEHLTFCLERGVEFRKRFGFKKERKYPPFAVIYGNTTDTRIHYMYDSSKRTFLSLDLSKNTIGDGVVSIKCAEMPEGYSVWNSFSSSFTHRTLMCDNQIFSVIDSLHQESLNKIEQQKQKVQQQLQESEKETQNQHKRKHSKKPSRNSLRSSNGKRKKVKEEVNESE